MAVRRFFFSAAPTAQNSFKFFYSVVSAKVSAFTAWKQEERNRGRDRNRKTYFKIEVRNNSFIHSSKHSLEST